MSKAKTQNLLQDYVSGKVINKKIIEEARQQYGGVELKELDLTFSRDDLVKKIKQYLNKEIDEKFLDYWVNLILLTDLDVRGDEKENDLIYKIVHILDNLQEWKITDFYLEKCLGILTNEKDATKALDMINKL